MPDMLRGILQLYLERATPSKEVQTQEKELPLTEGRMGQVPSLW